MIFKKEKNGSYQLTDLKPLIEKLKEKLPTWKFETVDRPMFPYQRESKRITLSCSEVVFKPGVDPENMTLDILTEITSSELERRTIIQDVEMMWLHSVEVNHREELSVIGFVKYHNDPLEKFLVVPEIKKQAGALK